jgi:hypothetical protein
MLVMLHTVTESQPNMYGISTRSALPTISEYADQRSQQVQRCTHMLQLVDTAMLASVLVVAIDVPVLSQSQHSYQVHTSQVCYATTAYCALSSMLVCDSQQARLQVECLTSVASNASAAVQRQWQWPGGLHVKHSLLHVARSTRINPLQC